MSVRFGLVAMSAAAPDNLTSLTRPYRIGRQRVHVHLRMPDQRNSLIDSLGPDESVVLRRAVPVPTVGIASSLEYYLR